jgi:hypothetical protein
MRKPWPLIAITAATLVVSTAAINPAHATTSQFVARMYSEVLGRAPDESGWAANAVANVQTGSGCQNINFAALANNYYSSSEYASLNYTSIEKALTLYRGLLNREPESSSSLQAWAQQLDAGTPMLTVITNFVNSAEFVSLKSTICSTSNNTADSGYRWGTTPTIPIDGTMTASALQASLDAAKLAANKQVVLSPHTVIYADRKITIPAGVTLTTSGITSRQQYAKMARIVRTAHFGGDGSTGQRGDQAIVVLENGAKMSAIWVSGQRGAVIAGQALPYSLLSSSVFMRGGTGTSVLSSRLDTGAGNSNIGIDGAYEGSPCQNAVINDNLITGYANTHYPVGGVGKYSDGITVACEKATVNGNHIIDASDVGIILFRSGSVPQASIVSNNIIISAGVSAFSAMAYEPYVEPSGTASYNFTGSQFYSNRFWTSGDSHFDIGVAAGTRAWGEQNTGYGGNVSGNTNAGIASIMQIGIGIDGMQTTVVNANQLSYVKQTNGVCPTKGAVVVNSDATRATPGSISSGTAFTYGTLTGCNMGQH